MALSVAYVAWRFWLGAQSNEGGLDKTAMLRRLLYPGLLVFFFTVKLHSYIVKYRFFNFSTQWNSIG